MFKIKRVYSERLADDGFRVLIDRLWPRGISKDKAHIDLWLKDIAPSTSLRIRFGHKHENWEEFIELYKRELENNKQGIKYLMKLEKEKGVVTLLYAAKDERRNHALVLLDFLNNYK